MEKKQLDVDQEAAVAAMLAGRNVFLTGSAGTGKTVVVKTFLERCKRRAVVVAPTGVAAINAKGQTLHSFFALPPGLLCEDSLPPLKWKGVRTKIQTAETLVVDEISMVRSDVFWAVDHRCRECAKGALRRVPFGGKQIVVVGDFFQLPPVVRGEFESDWLDEKLGGELAFETDVWKEAMFETHFLKTQHRQTADSRFVELLEKLRRGKSISEKIDLLSELNADCAVKKKKLPSHPIRLCTTNYEAQLINDYFRKKLDGKPHVYVATVRGKFAEDDYPTEATLELKPGCRVMVLRNKHKPQDGFFYVNGDCGTVLELDKLGARVAFDNGNTCLIEGDRWANYRYVVGNDPYTGKKTFRREEIGSFEQLPLKLAYATTIHKSQGMTLESVDLRLGNGCFAHGQLYTALSRAKSISGLRFQRAIEPRDVIVDERILDFYAQTEANPGGAPSLGPLFETMPR